MIILGALGCGVLLAHLTDHDLTTMLLATVPGGAADVTAAALDLNGEVAVVAAFQLLRQLTIFLVIALIFGRPARGGGNPARGHSEPLGVVEPELVALELVGGQGSGDGLTVDRSDQSG